ncbi:hypothetical protein RFI_21008 [Reticulomyxa filosa]|uniref:Uncharacterized protein n=1 Tax=Reticulomyxa filosa TaxID=46433 RepID=X6MTB4_RETFI|nr:hypothetical protein RFI_21008 [Reticulomyxa filosa]|eukprot:ETO16345.1 hypothetical protein RFI_21008 [Reticulomyxa filosa]
MLQPAEMVKPYLSHVTSYLIADTQLKPPKQSTDANLEFKKVFGKLPITVRERRVKKALRRKMKMHPGLRKRVQNARKFNLEHPKKRDENDKMKKKPSVINPFRSQDVFKKATLAQTEERENNERLKVQRVNTWKSILQQRLVKKNKRKPSFQGMKDELNLKNYQKEESKHIFGCYFVFFFFIRLFSIVKF